MSPEGDRSVRVTRVLRDLVRSEIRGDVATEDHDRGRSRALAAFARSPKPRRAMGVWLAAAAIACAIVVALIAWPRAPLRFTVDGAIASSGYVHASPGGQRAIVGFSDGTEIAFAPGASGRVAEVGPHGARVQLESGTASVRVVHTPAARWSIEAGPFVIAVIGTRFDVAWSSEAQALEVHLYEGAIAVRGPLAPRGIDLRAGQRLVARVAEGEIRIDEGAPILAEKASIDAPAPVAPPAVVIAPPPSVIASVDAPAPPSPRVRSWPDRVAAGDFRGVLADAEARGIDRAIKLVPLADLVALADAARYAGRSDVARRALTAERDRFPSTAEARAAAFLLGRLADDAGGAPGDALRWYDAYLSEAPRGAFAAEALGRKMIVLQRGGDAAARAVADAYLRLHPKGPHAAAAREIVSR